MQSNMTARSTAVCLGIALLLCTATSVQAKDGKIVTVIVDCAAGDSINEALLTNAAELTVLVDGYCVENVVINRDNVTLAGANPTNTNPPTPTDTIQSDPGANPSQGPSFGNVVLISEVANVRVQDLILTGGTRAGLTVVGFGRVDRCEITDNKRGLRVRFGQAIVRDTEFSGNFRFDVGQGLLLARGIEVGPYAGLTCRHCTSMDNLPLEVDLPDELKGDVFDNAIEEALLVFSHSQAFVGRRGGNSSILSGRSSVSVDENSFADIRGGSDLFGAMVVSDKSHLEIANGSVQVDDLVFESVIRLDSLLEVSDVGTTVGNIRVHDFSYLRSDDAILNDVEVE